MVNLDRKVDNLSSEVEGIEVIVEAMTMGVLNEVFGLQNPPPVC